MDEKVLEIIDMADKKGATPESIAEANKKIKHLNKKRALPKQEKDKYVSFYEKDGHIYEPIKTQEGVKFMTLNSTEPKIVDEIDGYKPYDNNAVKKGAVLLPDGIEEFGDIPTLVKDIQDFIHRYLDVSPLYEKIASWYVLLTWVYDKMDTIPYLRPLGDTGTGKTRFLDTVGRICYKPISIAGAVKPAPIYRLIEIWKGTLIVDEADFKDSDYYNEVVTIFNVGWQKGKPVIRCDKDNPDDIQIFDPFCPKLLGSRDKFKDKALESRCITEVTKETRRTDIPINLPKRFYDEQDVIRNKLLLFRLRYWDKIDPDKIQDIDLGNIEPRLKQAMNPLTSLFSTDEKMLKEFKEFLVSYQKELVEERATSYDGKIVNTLFSLLNEGKIHVSSKDVAERLNIDYPIGKDKKYNHITIGRKIKNLGLEIKVQRIDGEPKRCIVLDLEKLTQLFKRYVTDVTGVTDVTLVSWRQYVTDVTDVTGKQHTLKEVGGDTHVTSVTSVTSVTERKEKIMDLIPESEPESYFILEQKAENCGIDPMDFKEVVDKELSVGHIYEPRSGFLKKI